eukprot:NODE_15041_length_1071_cov_7.927966.p5 GENE.NODE_15041_length_1071_cov_7.927966~~NODE_15041_length_1071_cov_7.927966.p5  ORF type:complete len:61 (+),score=11.33 NODE_15041_length_1071_cov_7.927966:495-677(+)
MALTDVLCRPARGVVARIFARERRSSFVDDLCHMWRGQSMLLLNETLTNAVGLLPSHFVS